MNRDELHTRLREMAEQVISAAGKMIAAVANGAEPNGIADPEPWTIKAMYARRILAALDSGRRVDPRWMVGIATARATKPANYLMTWR